jgi:D-tyrosyl-tRNA(Tyr) deacylase
VRTVIQRVSRASVAVDGQTVADIGQGLLVFVGIEDADSDADADWLAAKITGLRIFADTDGIMNLSVNDIGGEILVVSQFTLHAMTKKGNRPSYVMAAKPQIAVPLYERFIGALRKLSGKDIMAGIFGADMQVSLVNDGPVTIWIDSKNKS